MYEMFEDLFYTYVQYGILFLELIGVSIIVFTAARCLWQLFKRDEKVRLDLAEGIAIALEFKLGGEVLRTTLVRDWNELGIVGAIVTLRIIMTFLIHWEIRNEQSHLSQENLK